LGGLLGRNWPFSGSFAMPTYEQTDGRTDEETIADKRTKDGGEGRERDGRREGRWRAKDDLTTKQETVGSFY
jgi:hypothetical protein